MHSILTLPNKPVSHNRIDGINTSKTSEFLRQADMIPAMPARRFTRRRLLQSALAAAPGAALARHLYGQTPPGLHIAPGPFQATWESLRAGYKTPDWFRD